MSNKLERKLAEVDDLRKIKEVYYCQLQRERTVEEFRQYADPVLTREVDALHREREYLTKALAEATGRSIADVRTEYREKLK